MIFSNIFDDQINIYWDKAFGIEEELIYDVYLDDKKIASTEFTHHEFYGLIPETDYKIGLLAINKNTEALYKKYDSVIVKTKARKTRIDITDSPYNAVGDGKTINTASIQSALDNCGENEQVYIPEGVFLTGSLNMHSECELYLEKGAILLGSTNRDDYLPMRVSRFEGYEMERCSAMINVGKIDNSGVINCKNIVIRGAGEIRGGAGQLMEDVIQKGLAEMKDELEQMGDLVQKYDRIEVIPGRLRPFLIDINNCDTAIITGLKVGYGSAWNIHFAYCKNVTVSCCDIASAGIWNGDGIDPDSSLNTVIYNIKFNTHDDAIAIKSGKNPEGNKIGIPTNGLKIFHIRGSFGIAVGSELSGGIENVKIWDVDIYKGIRGFRIKTSRDRGGYVKNIMLSNVKVPVFSVDTIYEWNIDGEPAGTLTEVEDLYFENITAKGNPEAVDILAYFTIYGFSEPEHYFKNVTLKNITVYSGTHSNGRELKIDNVHGLKISGLNILSETYKEDNQTG